MLRVTWPDNKMRVIFCDVGQGDGAIISQGTSQLLIDVGPNNKKILRCLEEQMPFWDKTIEGIIITHEDADHNGGLKDIRQNYKVVKIFSNAYTEQNIYTEKIDFGDIVRMGMIYFEVIGPGEDWGNSNDNSVVGKLNCGDKKMFFMGDASAQVEQKLVWRGILRQAQNEEVDILKVSHHGSGGGTSEELLETVKPKMALISVGKNNRYGHPTDEVIERLKQRGIEIRRTDLEGDIIVPCQE